MSQLAITLVVLSVAFSSCSSLWSARSNVDKPSPGGHYRIKFENTKTDAGTWSFHEKGQMRLLSGVEEIYESSWDYDDSLEDSVAGMCEHIDWVQNNVVRLAGSSPDTTNADILIVANQTDQMVRHVSVLLGKYERFHILDLAPNAETSLQINRKPPFISATVSTDRKKRFSGFLDDATTTSSNGTTTFRIGIKQKDLN